jgi:hypothetical protein
MILAGFATEQDMTEAVRRLRDADAGAIETYSPAPPDSAPSPLLPLIMLAAGVAGAVAGFALQAYATGIGYVIDIGGRPSVFWPAYVPFAFETGALFAMGAGFVGFLILNRLPALYHPIDECDGFRASSRDAWFVAVSPRTDAQQERARDALGRLHPVLLDEADG